MHSPARLILPILILFSGGLFPVLASDVPNLAFIAGPRVGVSYSIVEDSTAYYQPLIDTFGVTSFSAINSLFAVNLEQRIRLGESSGHFAIQGVVSAGGLEQSVFIPSAALLLGYRDQSGFELGVGPFVSLAGFSVMAALGWTFDLGGVYVPLDISVVLPNSKSATTIALTTGFNFVLSSR